MRTKTLSILWICVFTGGLAVVDGAAQVTMVELEDGTTIAGPAKQPGYFHFEDRGAIAVVNVNCPSDSTTISETATASTDWNAKGEISVEGGWGAISAALSASFGHTIGESHSITISLTVSAGPYESKLVEIFPRYEKYLFLVWPPGEGSMEVEVFKPVGWMNIQKATAPTCECPEVRSTRDELDAYVQSLPPGDLQTVVLAAVAELDRALASFAEADVEDLGGNLLEGFAGAAKQLMLGGMRNGDLALIDSVLDTMASSADGIVTRAIATASVNIFDDDTQVPEISVQEAEDSLAHARAIAATAQFPWEYREAFHWFDRAHVAALRSRAIAGDAASLVACANSTDDPMQPGSGCVDPDKCTRGTVGLGQNTLPEAVLSVNGCTGGDGLTVKVKAGTPIHAILRRPVSGGNGKFVLHGNVGRPQPGDPTGLPAGIGTTCFDLLLPPAGNAAPDAVWNNLGKTHLVGSSQYFGSFIEDPSAAPCTFLDLPVGDALHLPPGTILTIQGIVVDPFSASNKLVSVTNAVMIEIVE